MRGGRRRLETELVRERVGMKSTTDGPEDKSAKGSSSRRSEGGELRGGDTGAGGLGGRSRGIAGGREKVEVEAAAESDRARVDWVGEVSKDAAVCKKGGMRMDCSERRFLTMLRCSGSSTPGCADSGGVSVCSCGWQRSEASRPGEGGGD